MPTPSSTALDALAYRKETEGRQHENKNGMYVYDGDPAQYRTWKFRAEMVVVGNEDDDTKYADGMRRIMNALKNEPLRVAERIGIKTLIKPPSTETDVDAAQGADERELCGLPRLIKEIGDLIFPNSKDDAQDIFRAYNKLGGILSRQSGETMVSFVDRRHVAWQTLTDLDDSLQIGPSYRTDLLLDNAGLTKDQKLMVQASIQNSKDYDKTVKALKFLFNKIHHGEKSNTHEGKGGASKPYRPYGKGKRLSLIHI